MGSETRLTLHSLPFSLPSLGVRDLPFFSVDSLHHMQKFSTLHLVIEYNRLENRGCLLATFRRARLPNTKPNEFVTECKKRLPFFPVLSPWTFG